MGQQERSQTRECSIDQLHSELLKSARQYISNVDRVLLCFANKWEVFDKGLFGDSFLFGSLSASICTQNRVISIIHHLSDSDKRLNGVWTMELADIEMIQENQETLYTTVIYRINVTGRGGATVSVDFYSSETQAKFASVLRDAVARAKGKTSLAVTGSASNTEERIRTLKKLRQDGLITEAQFQQKIQEIVNQL